MISLTGQEKVGLAISAGLGMLAVFFALLGDFVDLCFAVILFAAAGYFFVKTVLGPFMSAYVGVGFADGIHYPTNVRAAPKEYPEIRAKIAKGDYEEAIKELMRIRADEPGNYIVLNMLADLLIDEMKDYERAVMLMQYHLKKSVRTADDAGLVLKYVDLMLDAGEEKRASDLLVEELGRNYPKEAVGRLRSRLESLSGC